MHGRLEYFTKEAVDEVQDLDNTRSSYADHRKKLTLLEQTAWYAPKHPPSLESRQPLLSPPGFFPHSVALVTAPADPAHPSNRTLHRWDDIAGETTVAKAVDTMWLAFNNRVSRLADGAESIVARLRCANHKSAAEDFMRVWEMAPLWSDAETPLSSKAKALKSMFEGCVQSVQSFLAGKCASVREGVLGDR